MQITNGEKDKNTFRNDINGLRAIAVIAVIINHINGNFLVNGYLGVDIFFVISGFVITSSLQKRQTLNLKEYFIGFYERRIKRIIPALFFYVFAITILISFFNPEPANAFKTGFLSFFGLSNIYLYEISNNYFSDNVSLNPFTQTWSLAVEEQFYLIFPIIVWVSGFGKGKIYGRKLLTIFLTILSVVSIIGFYYFHETNINAAYYLMPFRFWEMSIGGLTFLLQSNIKRFLNRFDDYFACISFLIIISSFMLPNISISNLTLIAVLSTSLLITNINQNTSLYKFLTIKLLMHIGKISYSLYLWHWGIISISKWTIGIHWWSIPFQILLMYAISLISFKYIEEPFRNLKSSLKGIYTLIFGISTMIISSLIYCIGFIRTPKLLALNKLKTINEFLYLGKIPTILGSYSSPFIPATYHACGKHSLTDEKCITKPSNPNKQNIFLVGDSHAGHLIPLLGKIHKDYGFGTLVSTHGHYPTKHFTNKFGIDLAYAKERFNRTNREFEKKLKLLSKDDIVFLSARLDFYFIEPIITSGDKPIKHYSDELEEINVNKSLNIWLKKLDDFATNMKSRDINIVVMAPMPVFKGVGEIIPHALHCYKEWFRPYLGEKCRVFTEDKEFLKNRVKPLTIGLKEIQKKHNNLEIYDAFDKICPGKVCINRTEDEFIVIDTNHISFETAEKLSADFYSFLKNKNFLKGN